MKVSNAFYATAAALAILLPFSANLEATIFHTYAGVAVIFFSAVVAMLVVMPKVLPNSPLPNAQKLAIVNRTIFGFTLAGLSLMATVCFNFYNTMRSDISLQNRGVKYFAEVDNLYVEDCLGHGGCSYGIGYSYVVSGKKYKARHSLGANFLGTPYFKQAQATGHIPILYDASDPANSEPNFTDSLRTSDPVFDFWGLVVLAGAAIGFVFGILIFVMNAAREAVLYAISYDEFSESAG